METTSEPRLAAYSVPLAVLFLATILACRGDAPPERDADPIAATTPASSDTASEPSLLAIMLGLEADMADVARGIWRSDARSIAAAATDIADHPKIPAEGRATIARTLGAEMSDFAALDRDVHDAAVRLRESAEAEDFEAALDAWQTAQDGCAECHRRFRDRLRPLLSGATTDGG